MSKFQANGFEIDEDNPMIPLASVMKAMDAIQHQAPKAWEVFNKMLNDMSIPMHILAETDQANVEG